MTDTLDASRDAATRPHASVIVCTYNRAGSLARTLASLAAQKVRDEFEWEVIVVDNNSRDDTRQVVERFSVDFPRLRYCFEGRQGLSHARNRGIELARGEFLLFTDDDVAPEPDWVERIVDGMISTACDACGGFIAPVWEAPPPPWLTERFHGFLAIRAERTDTFQILRGMDPPFGANMAFRREVFARHGGFDVRRGRMGNVLASGEDGELFERILKGGGKVMYFGAARVHHSVEAYRLTRKYLRRWRYQSSRNIAESKGLPGSTRVGGVPLYLFPQLARAIARAFVARLTDSPDAAFYKELIVCHFLGTIHGLWRTRRAASRN